MVVKIIQIWSINIIESDCLFKGEYRCIPVLGGSFVSEAKETFSLSTRIKRVNLNLSVRKRPTD